VRQRLPDISGDNRSRLGVPRRSNHRRQNDADADEINNNDQGEHESHLPYPKVVQPTFMEREGRRLCSIHHGPGERFPRARVALQGRRFSRLAFARQSEWMRDSRDKGLGMSDKPPVGGVRFGDFDRIDPIGAYFSRGRGTSVDRFYIARFLEQHSADVKGRVLEIEENRYASQFGGDRVTRVDVLDIWPENPRATI